MLLSALLSLAVPSSLPVQPQELDDVTRVEAIEVILEALEDNYVFPDVARRMAEDIRSRLARGDYDSVRSGQGLAGALQTDLRAICKDLHLSVSYNAEAEALPEEGAEQEDDGGRPPSWWTRQRRNNWGFRKVEVLPGNVGLIELGGFAPVNEESALVASGAMNFLAGTDALIVDLRQNGGGSPAMVAYLTTYLFGPEPVHLNSLEEPRRGTSHQWWTLPHVPGRRFGPDKPVFVLTSKYTFSAAEEFTYNLHSRERATVVGENTGGGAHPVTAVQVHPHFSVWLPFARAVNPITGTNWEGTGVSPHIEIEAMRALTEAHLTALDTLIDGTEDEDRRGVLLQAVQQVEARR